MAITYYLSHRDAINAYLKPSEAEFESMRQSTNEPAFSRKLTEARRQMQMSQS